ncbi:MAG: amidohydrolase [Gordonia sp. (in: high G+C Gram-positive bacteria)]
MSTDFREPEARISPARLDALRSTAIAAAERHGPELRAISHEIHAHPELAFAEHHAAELMARTLESHGFTVTRGAYGVETAVEAVVGDGEFRVVLCAEYDALPELGHACGHNVIAAIGLGSALILAEVADELGLQVVLLGTPAEEHGGGKCALLRAGAFEGATISSMVHGGAAESEVSAARVSMQCVDRFDVTFLGRQAHAAAAPFEAINAGAAATIAHVAVGLLRQQLRDGIRLSVITTSAGTVTNIVPGRAELSVEVRSRDLAEMLSVKERVLACMAGAALATGCEWSQRRAEPRYLNVVPDDTLAAAWDRNLAVVGRRIDPELDARSGSTDMGNVSHVVPSLHPILTFAGSTAPPHTIEFASDAIGAGADQAVIDGALVQALMVIDVVADPDQRADLLRRAAERPAGATRIDQDLD